MTRTITTMGLAALLAVPIFAEAQQQKKAQRPNAGQAQRGQGARRLLGTYTIVSGSSAGKEIPEDRLGGRVRITEDQILINDTDDNEVYVVDYVLDRPEGRRGANPAAQTKGQQRRGMGRAIRMTTVRSSVDGAEGSTARGLFKIEDGTITLIYDFGEGDHVPTDFEAEEETENLFVLEKVDDAVEDATDADPDANP